MATYPKTTLERIEIRLPKLKGEKLPLVVDDWTLAFRLGLSGKALWYALHHRDDLYRVFKIKKASGGLRTIHNPQPLMRFIAKRIRKAILLPLCEELGAHVGAYQVGKSTVDNARQHLNDCPVCAKHDQPHTCSVHLVPNGKGDGLTSRRTDQGECVPCQPTKKHTCARRGVKVHLDLKDFFKNTRRSWIRKYFHQVVGYDHYVSGLLAHLLTVTMESTGRKQYKFSGVPQGSLASGDICNLIADWRIDQPLLMKLRDTGWTYTRYADDLYLSHPENLSRAEVDNLIAVVSEVIADSGYRVNLKKTRIQRPATRQHLLGITINEKVGLPKQEYKRFRALLHHCVHHGFTEATEKHKKETEPRFQSWLLGKLSYFKAIDPTRTERLHLMYQEAMRRHGNTTNMFETQGDNNQ